MPDQPTTPEQRQAAMRAVWRAVRDGTLTKPTTCEDCGDPRLPIELHAHHHKGYTEKHWLDVIFLCPECHGKAHGRTSIPWFTNEQNRRGVAASAASMKRSEVARSGYRAMTAKLTSEKRSARSRKARQTWLANTTFEERSAAAKARHAKLSQEERSTLTHKRWSVLMTKYTAEERSAISRRAWKTRRANAEARRLQATNDDD